MKWLFLFLFYAPLFVSAQREFFTLQDTSVEAGCKLTERRFWFYFDKADLLPESYSFMDSLVVFLQKNPGAVMEIRCHSDTRASNEYSICLTCKRARAIAGYLVKKGTDSRRLLPKGYSDSNPLISEEEINRITTQEEKENAHRMNRRIEFIILRTDFTTE